MAKMPTSHQMAVQQLVRSLHKGRVTAIQTLEDGQTQLTVDFFHLGYLCSVQLVHWHENWDMKGPPTMVKAPKRTAPVLATTAVFAVLLLGSAWIWSSGGFGARSNAMSVKDAIQYIEAEGYIVMTPEEKNEMVTAAEENGYEKARQKLAKQEETDESGEDSHTEGDKGQDSSADDEKEKKERVDLYDERRHDVVRRGVRLERIWVDRGRAGICPKTGRCRASRPRYDQANTRLRVT